MSEIFYDLTKPSSGLNYRWIQPPQVAYFVTTVDGNGNVNSAPVTLGTCVSVDMELDACGNFFFGFSVCSSDVDIALRRDTQSNLEEVSECVISYIGSHLFRETQIASLPLPPGISELEVMGLTELPSQKVAPPGIKECKVNMEAKVVSATQLGKYYKFYMCQVVAVSVDSDLVEVDNNSELHAGIVNLDPLFEITVLGGELPPRIHTVQLDLDSVRSLPAAIGPTRAFVGIFNNWMEDEVTKGKITSEECAQIIALNDQWQQSGTVEIKKELTARIKNIIG